VPGRPKKPSIAVRAKRASCIRQAKRKTAPRLPAVKKRLDPLNGESKTPTTRASAPANGHRAAALPPANGQAAPRRSELVKKNGKPVNGNTIPGPGGDLSAEAPAAIETGGQISKLVQQDRDLVDECLTGAPGAWSRMYARFQGTLLASIRAFLGRAAQDFHLIDEISARVWYALVRNDFELLAKFDAARNCRFSTFLSVLAKTETRLLLRSERRRKLRELVASRPEIESPEDSVLTDGEFVATLSPAERMFFNDVLLSKYAPEAEAKYTQENLWQLRHRVRRKLEQFLE